jgi:hypothetical protein
MLRVIAISLVVAAPASAQVYGLSPAEKSAAIEAASRRPDADNPALLPALTQDRRPHGEVGVMIGSGGARGIYGVVGVPVGDNGSATFAFSDTRLPAFYGYQPQGGGFLGRRDFARQTVGFGFRQPAW